MAEQASNSFDLFRSLRNRNYKLYFGGQGLSLIGTWMTQLATSWLVYRLAADQKPGQAAYYLGLVGFRRPVAHAAHLAIRRRDRRSCQPAPAAGDHPGSLVTTKPRASNSGIDAYHHDPAGALAFGLSRHDQCLRHAGAPILHGRHHRKPR